MRRATGWEPDWFEVESFRVITDDRSGVDTLTDETGATVTTEATVKVHVGGERVIATAEGNGPVNALDTALRKALNGSFPALERVHLTDYKVRVLDTQKGTGAVTRVLIDSTDGEQTWTTIGVNENIIEASWQALLDSIHFGLLRADDCSGASVPTVPLGRFGARSEPGNVAPCRPTRSFRPTRPTAPPAAEPAARVSRRRRRATGAPTVPGDLAGEQPDGALLGQARTRTSATRTRSRTAGRTGCGSRPHEHADDAIAVIAEIAGKRAALVRARAGDRRHRRRDRAARLRRRRRRAFVEKRAAARARGAHSYRPPPGARRRRPRRAAALRRPCADGRAEWRSTRARSTASRHRADRSPRHDGQLRPPRRVSRSCASRVRRLAETQIAPNAAAADEDEEYPWASWNAWRDAGFAGLAFPEEYGGQGGGILAHALAVEEVARVCASSSLFTFISKLAMTPVLDHGSRSAQAEVRDPGRGGGVPGVVLPLGGRRGQRRGGHAHPGGPRRRLTTCSPAASCGSPTRASATSTLVFAKTDPDAGHRGISCFVVEKAFPGFCVVEARAQDGRARLPDRRDRARRRAWCRPRT